MAFPKVFYVKHAHEGEGREFIISTDWEKLVGLEPVQIATYDFRATAGHKRIIVSDQPSRARQSKLVPRKGKPSRWEAPI
jgi:hypothetical protein